MAESGRRRNADAASAEEERRQGALEAARANATQAGTDADSARSDEVATDKAFAQESLLTTVLDVAGITDVMGCLGGIVDACRAFVEADRIRSTSADARAADDAVVTRVVFGRGPR